MAEVFDFPTAPRGAVVIDRDGTGFALTVFRQQGPQGHPQRADEFADLVGEGILAAAETGLSLIVLNRAIEWIVERQIGPRP